MTRLIRPLVTMTLSLALAAVAGCASSGSTASTIKPGEPVPLEGARYKLLAAGGQLDGRVVEFLQRGDTLVGCLAAPGNKLRSATGVDVGLRVFSMSRKQNNEWEGVYRAVGSDGSVADKPVAVSFEGDGMSWNLESATWERQSESAQLDETQKKTCTGK
jgi:hypothetical protein